MRQLGGNVLTIVVGAVLSMAAVACYGAEGAQWSYGGATGPAKWSSLEKGFAQCKLGQTQSPIDIPDASARKGDLPSMLFNYKPSPLKIIDNGHTIEVDYAPGSFVTVEGKRYELVQFHLVHQGPGGRLAVVAVLLDAGKENLLIKTLWDNLPKEKGKENVVDAVKINAVDLLPQNKGYYTFAGSLTTPPCSEEVTWFVMKTPVQVSADEIARFARSYPMNARPVQPLNGRDIQATR